MINKTVAKEAFADYVSSYDLTVGQNALKVKHTYKAAKISEEIARAMGLSKEDADLAWLIGLLHDIARFEQNRLYGTFNDLVSVDHGDLAVEILFDDGKIRDFIKPSQYDEIIKKAILYHNKYAVGEDVSPREGIFCNIIRDADKLDIFRVNNESSKEDVYEVSEEAFLNSEFSEAVFKSFFDERVVLKQLKKNAIDGLACHLSFIYDIAYPQSLKIALSQGYIKNMMTYKTQNKRAGEQLREMSEYLMEYINRRIGQNE